MKNSSTNSFIPPLWIITLISAFAAIWVLYQLKELVVLLVVGYSIAYVLDPLLDSFQRRGISRERGFFLLCVISVLAMLLFYLLAVPTLIGEFTHLFDNLSNYFSTANDRFASILGNFQRYIPSHLSVADIQARLAKLPTPSGETLKTFLGGIWSFLFQGYSITLTLANFFLLPFIVYYLLIDIDKFHLWVTRLFPRGMRLDVRGLFQEMDRYVSAFVKGQILISAILFVCYSFGFWLVGLNLWFLLGFITGFGNLIPYVGTLVGIILSSVIALVSFGDLNHLLYTWAVFGVMFTIEGTFLTPKILGDKVELSPLLVILAIFAGGKLFGLLGVFLAVPGAAIIKVLMKRFHNHMMEKM